MKFSFFTLCILLLTSPFGIRAAQISKEDCRVIVKDFERISNVSPQEVEAQAPETLEKLRNGETLQSFFIAYNIYIENLLNKGKIDKARSEIAQMLKQSSEQENEECKVIALRTQGQFYYKLGLYNRASECFREAMELCPRYDSPLLEHCFTWSSTLFWLVQADINCGRLEEASHWINQMDGMMSWLDATGNPDNVGYKQVMIRGLKAKIALQNGNLEEAKKLLRECPQFIRDDVPSRAYVEYYVAKMLLLVKENKHADALPIIDELIEMHVTDFKPIAAEFIYQKGLSLAALGQYEASTKALCDYIKLKDQVNEVALAQQLEELTSQYEVERLQRERDNMSLRFWIVFALCFALCVIVVMSVVNQKKLRRKNKSLALTISELNRFEREGSSSPAPISINDEDTQREELLKIGKQIVDYINNSRCYLNANCNREMIKQGTGVSDRILAKAIMEATGLSFVNYINQLRLNVSIEMLEDKSEMTISDISHACGFGTVRQFQRIFKLRYDLSPSAYREAYTSAKNDSPS